MENAQSLSEFSFSFIRKFFLVALYFIMSSCCTKMDCSGVDAIYKIEFSTFTSEQIDSVLLVSYNPIYQINLPTDSLIVMLGNASMSRPFIYFPRKFDPRLDYKLKLYPGGEIYNISNFDTRSAVCNKCFLGNDYYDYLANYMVNGKPFQEADIKLF